ncbi:TRAP transporter small permease subunit [Flammeovirgaceae bacterium SG7u.111]|nr:TRAP transporter small permease subunit [Flammeovirgaceae bacterium SG7u.132]WPO35781.1 TRAP transporter small permease subunit [Flammeovirgaceae bacterium SG7u.111]
MVKFLNRYVRFVDQLNEYVGISVSFLTSALVLLICYDVITRYLFSVTHVAIFELEWHIFALIFILGAAYTLKHDKHVRVDIFYSRFSEKGKALVNLFGTIFFLVPFCLVVINGGIPYLETSLKLSEGSNDPGGLPARYIIKGSIIVGFSLLLLQGTSLIITSFFKLTGKNGQVA